MITNEASLLEKGGEGGEILWSLLEDLIQFGEMNVGVTISVKKKREKRIPVLEEEKGREFGVVSLFGDIIEHSKKSDELRGISKEEGSIICRRRKVVVEEVLVVEEEEELLQFI